MGIFLVVLIGAISVYAFWMDCKSTWEMNKDYQDWQHHETM